jgi:hypothetical protein
MSEDLVEFRDFENYLESRNSKFDKINKKLHLTLPVVN